MPAKGEGYAVSEAIVFARAGCRVALYDGQAGVADRPRQGSAQSLRDLQAHELLGDPCAVLANISIAPDLDAALNGALYAQESVFEEVDIKRASFSEIYAVIGADTLVGSSSSGIPASACTSMWHAARGAWSRIPSIRPVSRLSWSL